jgi:hypothetical protein
MLAHKQTREVAPQPPLEDRIASFRKELDKFITARALELKQGTGLPLPIILQLLNQNLGCQCSVAAEIVATRKRDAEIAAREESK